MSLNDNLRRRALNRMPSQYANIIQTYVKSLEQLDKGKVTPKTPLQEQFVNVCRGKENATTLHEIAYLRYKHALKQITEYTSSNNRRNLNKFRQDKGHLKPRLENKYGIPEFEEGQPRPGFRPLDRFE